MKIIIEIDKEEINLFNFLNSANQSGVTKELSKIVNKEMLKQFSEEPKENTNITVKQETTQDNLTQISKAIQDKAAQTLEKAVKQTQPEQPEQQAPTQEQPAIPTTTIANTYTQEQLAKAMATGIEAGKMDFIRDVLSKFNANSLMEIDKSKYDELASMLVAGGVKV